MMEPARPKPPIIALFILLFVALVLAVVALIRTAGVSPIESWASAMNDGDYAEAALLLTDEEDAEEWFARTEALTLTRGGVQDYQRSDRILLPPGEGSVSVVRLNWADGFTNCLLLRQGEDDSLGVVGSYFDCDTLSERVPERGQLLPEADPPNDFVVPPQPSGPPDLPPAQEGAPGR